MSRARECRGPRSRAARANLGAGGVIKRSSQAQRTSWRAPPGPRRRRSSASTSPSISTSPRRNASAIESGVGGQMILPRASGPLIRRIAFGRSPMTATPVVPSSSSIRSPTESGIVVERSRTIARASVMRRGSGPVPGAAESGVPACVGAERRRVHFDPAATGGPAISTRSLRRPVVSRSIESASPSNHEPPLVTFVNAGDPPVSARARGIEPSC
jgi:hypothetical protein